MKIREICAEIERIAPLALQENYDNSGLQIGNPDAEITRVLISLDVTENVVNEAIAKNCNLILSHHPLIFRGLKKLTPDTDAQRAVIAAVRHDIAVYSAHTNVDNAADGMNRIIAQKLGLKNGMVLCPQSSENQQNAGTGFVGELPAEMSETDFLAFVKKMFRVAALRHSPLTGKMLKKVAFVGGSGASFVADAKRAAADVFLTGDIKYHDYFEADGKLLLVDFGHYESEQFVKNYFSELLGKKFPQLSVEISENGKNPINTFI